MKVLTRSARFVLTRLHARYDKHGAPDDLVFKGAPAIAGGRERRGPNDSLERGASPSDRNNFQGRYAIRHEWTGPVECADPTRGFWGGPPPGTGTTEVPSSAPTAVTK